MNIKRLLGVAILAWLMPVVVAANSPYEDISEERRDAYRNSPYEHMDRHVGQTQVNRQRREVYNNTRYGEIYVPRNVDKPRQEGAGNLHCPKGSSKATCGTVWVLKGEDPVYWDGERYRVRSPTEVRYQRFQTSQGQRYVRTNHLGIPTSPCIPYQPKSYGISTREAEHMTEEELEAKTRAYEMAIMYSILNKRSNPTNVQGKKLC